MILCAIAGAIVCTHKGISDGNTEIRGYIIIYGIFAGMIYGIIKMKE
jgi:hypothetical protein